MDFLVKAEISYQTLFIMVTGKNKIRVLILFGKYIKSLRNKQNLILRQLAQHCDVDFSEINKIEKGDRNIQITTIIELAKGLGKQPKELFDFDFCFEQT